MPVCNFCDNSIPKGIGTLYAKKDGSISYFCSGKCRKNQLKLKREGRKNKWTKRYADLKEKAAKTKNK